MTSKNDSRAVANAHCGIRREHRSYWYGLFALSSVVTVLSAVAAATVPAEATAFVRILWGTLAGAVALTLGGALLVGTTYLWNWWHAPTRLLWEARTALQIHFAEASAASDLTTLIARLNECQIETLELLRELRERGRQAPSARFAAWNTELAALMREAGDDHYARYTARTAHVSVPIGPTTPAPMSDVYEGMIDLIAETISELTRKRDAAQSRAVAAVREALG